MTTKSLHVHRYNPQQTDQGFGRSAFWQDLSPAPDWTPEMREGYRAAELEYSKAFPNEVAS